jgi:hypothetical protein
VVTSGRMKCERNGCNEPAADPPVHELPGLCVTHSIEGEKLWRDELKLRKNQELKVELPRQILIWGSVLLVFYLKGPIVGLLVVIAATLLEIVMHQKKT